VNHYDEFVYSFVRFAESYPLIAFITLQLAFPDLVEWLFLLISSTQPKSSIVFLKKKMRKT